jgi:hypothetical protein
MVESTWTRILGEKTRHSLRVKRPPATLLSSTGPGIGIRKREPRTTLAIWAYRSNDAASGGVQKGVLEDVRAVIIQIRVLFSCELSHTDTGIDAPSVQELVADLRHNYELLAA